MGRNNNEQPTYVESRNGKFMAEIRYNGKPQPIYWDDVDQGDNHTSGYIISKSDQIYTVHICVSQLGCAGRIADRQDYNDLTVTLVIDGVEREQRITDFKDRTQETIDITGAGIGTSEEAPMYFTPMLIDSKVEPLYTPSSEILGTICLKNKRCRKKWRDRRLPDSKAKEVDAMVVFNEVDGKGPLSTVTGFTTPVKAGKSESYVAEDHPEDKASPYFIFEFRYRTKGVLAAQGILQYGRELTVEGESPSKQKSSWFTAGPINHVAIPDLKKREDSEMVDIKYAKIDQLEEKMDGSAAAVATANATIVSPRPKIRTPKRIARKKKPPVVSPRKRMVSDDEDGGYASPSPSAKLILQRR